MARPELFRWPRNDEISKNQKSSETVVDVLFSVVCGVVDVVQSLGSYDILFQNALFSFESS